MNVRAYLVSNFIFGLADTDRNGDRGGSCQRGSQRDGTGCRVDSGSIHGYEMNVIGFDPVGAVTVNVGLNIGLDLIGCYRPRPTRADADGPAQGNGSRTGNDDGVDVLGCGGRLGQVSPGDDTGVFHIRSHLAGVRECAIGRETNVVLGEGGPDGGTNARCSADADAHGKRQDRRFDARRTRGLDDHVRGAVEYAVEYVGIHGGGNRVGGLGSRAAECHTRDSSYRDRGGSGDRRSIDLGRLVGIQFDVACRAGDTRIGLGDVRGDLVVDLIECDGRSHGRCHARATNRTGNRRRAGKGSDRRHVFRLHGDAGRLDAVVSVTVNVCLDVTAYLVGR